MENKLEILKVGDADVPTHLSPIPKKNHQGSLPLGSFKSLEGAK